MPMAVSQAVDPRAPGFTGFQCLTTSHTSFHYFAPHSQATAARVHVDLYSCRPFRLEDVVAVADKHFSMGVWAATIVLRSPLETERSTYQVVGTGSFVSRRNLLSGGGEKLDCPAANPRVRFLGDVLPEREPADVLIFPLAYDGTASYGRGTAAGPQALLQASAQVELFDIELDCMPAEGLSIHTCEVEPYRGHVADVHARAVTDVRSVLQSTAISPKPFFLGVGGEHSMTYPLLKALLEESVLPADTTVLHVDAHADLRETWEPGERLSHACVMRRVRDDLRLRTVHLGVRALSREEHNYIERHRAPVFGPSVSPSVLDEVMELLPEHVYISFDVDALDPAIMPATGTPVPGGLSWQVTLELLRVVFAGRNVVGIDIMELAPIRGMHGANLTAALLALKTIGYRFRLRKDRCELALEGEGASL